MGNKYVKDFRLVTKASPTNNLTMEECALFDANGNPVTVLTGSNVMPVQAASVAADVATLKTDFNALLTKLKAAGLMASS